jgi:hypothetical protein
MCCGWTRENRCASFMEARMATQPQPGKQGSPRSRGDNSDSGAEKTERSARERATEGRSHKASDNASDKKTPRPEP